MSGLSRQEVPAGTSLSLRWEADRSVRVEVVAALSGTDGRGHADRRLEVRVGADAPAALDAGLFAGQAAFRSPGSTPSGSGGPVVLEVRLQADLARTLPDDAGTLVPTLQASPDRFLLAQAWFLTAVQGPDGGWEPTFWAGLTPTAEVLEQPGELLAAALPWLEVQATGPDVDVVRDALQAALDVVVPGEPSDPLTTTQDVLAAAGGQAPARTADGTGLVFQVVGRAGTWDCLVEWAHGRYTVSALPPEPLPTDRGPESLELVCRLNGLLPAATVLVDVETGELAVRSAMALGAAPAGPELLVAVLSDNTDSTDAVLPVLAAFRDGQDVRAALDALPGAGRAHFWDE